MWYVVSCTVAGNQLGCSRWIDNELALGVCALCAVCVVSCVYSTVTLLAKLRGWSISHLRRSAM